MTAMEVVGLVVVILAVFALGNWSGWNSGYTKGRERRDDNNEAFGLMPPMPWPTPGSLPPAKFQIGQPVMVYNRQGKLLELKIVSRYYFLPKGMWMYSFGDEAKDYGEDLIEDSPNYVRVASKVGHTWVPLNDQSPVAC